LALAYFPVCMTRYYASGLILPEAPKLITPTSLGVIKMPSVGSLHSLAPAKFHNWYDSYRTIFPGASIVAQLDYVQLYPFYLANQTFCAPSFFGRSGAKAWGKLLLSPAVQQQRVALFMQEYVAVYFRHAVMVTFFLNDQLRKQAGLPPATVGEDLDLFLRSFAGNNPDRVDIDNPLWGSNKVLSESACLHHLCVVSTVMETSPYVMLVNDTLANKEFFFYVEKILDFNSGVVIHPKLFSEKLNKVVRFIGSAGIQQRHAGSTMDSANAALFAELAEKHRKFFNFAGNNPEIISLTFPQYVGVIEKSWEYLPHSHEQVPWLLQQIVNHQAKLPNLGCNKTLIAVLAEYRDTQRRLVS